MASNAAKGQRGKLRAKAWLERNGYAVAFLERMLWIRVGPGRMIPKKIDQMGADLLAVNEFRTLYVQVKTFGTTDRRNQLAIKAALDEFAKHRVSPDSCQVVFVWRDKARLPELIYAPKQLTSRLNSTVEVVPDDRASETTRLPNDVAGETIGGRPQGRLERAPQGRRASVDERRSHVRRAARRVCHTSTSTEGG